MAYKGGYAIIDLKDEKIVSNGITILGLYDAIEKAVGYNKPTLVQGINNNGTLVPAALRPAVIDSGAFLFDLGEGNTLKITEADLVTIETE